jgi:hypothetical protein
MRLLTKRNLRLMGEGKRKLINRHDRLVLYSFFLEYRGGTYIYQYSGRTLEEALRVWAESLPIENVVGASNSFRETLVAEIDDTLKHNGPVPVSGVINIWVCTFLFEDHSVGILSIIATENSKDVCAT